MAIQNSVLHMKEITVEFPGVRALDSVSFTATPGSVHALIGANGAGKSTLMKVLAGAYSNYAGTITYNNTPLSIKSPKDAQQHGIQIVYQEVDTALIQTLTVAENILLSTLVHDMKGRQLINWSQLHKTATEILNHLKINVSSKKLVSELTLAQKQMVLIARAISTDCKILILDEPTAPLSHTETTELFRIIQSLKKNNIAIIFISHRLPEIFNICDEITVLRNGKFVTNQQINNTAPGEVIEHMLGKKLADQFPAKTHKPSETIYEVKGITDKSQNVRNISINAKAGEIVGVAGLVGAGKTELCKTLFGCFPIEAGDIFLRGKKLSPNSPYEVVKQGVALVPEERRKEGILVSESVKVNLTAAHLQKFTNPFAFVKKKEEHKQATELIEMLGIKTPSVLTTVEHLSGGNQQKVAIGKWLITDADVYIFDEPTKGVDVGAKRDIFELIVKLAGKGKSVIYASAELQEILGITDRTYVMYDGEVVKELTTKNTSEEEILYFAAGGK
ncbi:sugar ABC transporter ATP-binding protein [Bacillus sp. FJAT-45066]|uniref:sugar ABC transporter ATP-binding protein n=1 Tax=Bacillus sp. FJAT-45066 TaxID=2011010 RepID=UPI0034E95A7A